MKGGIDFSTAEFDPETGKRCILKEAKNNQMMNIPPSPLPLPNPLNCVHYTLISFLWLFTCPLAVIWITLLLSTPTPTFFSISSFYLFLSSNLPNYFDPLPNYWPPPTQLGIRGCQPKWAYSINLLFMSNRFFLEISTSFKYYVLRKNFDWQPAIALKSLTIRFFNTLLWLHQCLGVLLAPLNLLRMAVRIYLCI